MAATLWLVMMMVSYKLIRNNQLDVGSNHVIQVNEVLYKPPTAHRKPQVHSLGMAFQFLFPVNEVKVL